MPEIEDEVSDEEIDKLFEEIEAKQKPDLSPSEISKLQHDIEFSNKAMEDPVKEKTLNYKAMGKSMTFQPFLESLLFPEGIYESDKYLQMVAGWRKSWIERLLKKKRHMPFNIGWLIIVMAMAVVGIICAFIIISILIGAV